MDAVLQQPVTNKNMDRSGPEGTMGHVNFPKLFKWTARAHQEKELPWNTRASPTVN